MISVSEAIAVIKEKASQLPVERAALADALGRVLAEDVVADSDLPPFDRAQMDGYAVRFADVAKRYRNSWHSMEDLKMDGIEIVLMHLLLVNRNVDSMLPASLAI